MDIQLLDVRLQRKLRENTAGHVANVRHPLAEVLVGYLRKKRRVLSDHLLQSRGGIDLLGQYGGFDFADQIGIAEDHPMRAKNGGLFLPNLLADSADDGVEFLARGSAGGVEL